MLSLANTHVAKLVVANLQTFATNSLPTSHSLPQKNGKTNYTLPTFFSKNLANYPKLSMRCVATFSTSWA
jgi:hypothetical protein